MFNEMEERRIEQGKLEALDILRNKLTAGMKSHLYNTNLVSFRYEPNTPLRYGQALYNHHFNFPESIFPSCWIMPSFGRLFYEKNDQVSMSIWNYFVERLSEDEEVSISQILIDKE